MHRIAFAAAALGVSALAVAAQAQTQQPSWRSTIERQCVEQIGEQGGHWPEWARCTVARAFPETDPARVRQCIRQVAEIRDRAQSCNNCADPGGRDPVSDVIICSQDGSP